MLPPLKKTIFTIPVVSTRSQINQGTPSILLTTAYINNITLLDVLHTIKQDFVAWLNQGYLSVAAFNAIYKILLAGNEVAKAKLLFVAEKKREEVLNFTSPFIFQTITHINYSKSLRTREECKDWP